MPEYEKGKRPFPIPDVRAVIFDAEGRVLLIRRSDTVSFPGRWCIPGGKVDLGFTLRDALRKEMKEELGLEPTSTSLLFFKESLPGRDYSEHYITFFFECAISGEIVLNYESSEYAWVEAGDIGEYDVAFRHDEAMVRIFKEKENPDAGNRKEKKPND